MGGQHCYLLYATSTMYRDVGNVGDMPYAFVVPTMSG